MVGERGAERAAGSEKRQGDLAALRWTRGQAPTGLTLPRFSRHGVRPQPGWAGVGFAGCGGRRAEPAPGWLERSAAGVGRARGMPASRAIRGGPAAVHSGRPGRFHATVQSALDRTDRCSTHGGAQRDPGPTRTGRHHHHDPRQRRPRGCPIGRRFLPSTGDPSGPDVEGCKKHSEPSPRQSLHNVKREHSSCTCNDHWVHPAPTSSSLAACQHTAYRLY